MLHRLPLVVAVVAALVLAGSAQAAKLKYTGTIASDAGGFVRLTAKLKPVTADTYVGRVKCKRGALRCVGKRGGFTMILTATGWEALIRFTNGIECEAFGSGGLSVLVGEYACYSGLALLDTGVFQLNQRF